LLAAIRLARMGNPGCNRYALPLPALLLRRAPTSLKLFLTTAIVDDSGRGGDHCSILHSRVNMAVRL
jgi:hypothetical protein